MEARLKRSPSRQAAAPTGSAGSAQAPDPPKSGTIAAMSTEAMNFRRLGFKAQETMGVAYRTVLARGRLARIGEGTVQVARRVHFTTRKREKARKCEAFITRASLAGKAAGGRDWGPGRWRFLEALDIQSRLRRRLFVASCRAGPMGR